MPVGRGDVLDVVANLLRRKEASTSTVDPHSRPTGRTRHQHADGSDAVGPAGEHVGKFAGHRHGVKIRFTKPRARRRQRFVQPIQPEP